MRPVSTAFPINQPFGSMATAGVAANSNPASGTGYYVYLYGNYQPFGHAGCDIACPEGTPVYAIEDGTVLWADWGTNLPGDESNAGYRRRWYLYKKFPGIVTVIQHNGWIGVYAHLSKAPLSPGDRVTEGQVIALSGGTGGVAPHLHVEALVDLNYTTGGGLIYGRTSPEPYFGSAAIAPQGTITTPEPAAEEDDMYSDADRERDNRQTQILEAMEADGLRAVTKFIKGDAEDTLYEIVEATGALRGITLAEWQASGRGYRTVPQAVINALPKA